MRCFLVFLAVFVLAACATKRKSTLALMSAGALTGAVAGAQSAPPSENKDPHSLMWGAVGATVGALVGIYVFDSEGEIAKLQRTNTELADKLRDFSQFQTRKESLESVDYISRNYPKGFPALNKSDGFKLNCTEKWSKEGKDRFVCNSGYIELKK